MIYKFKSQAAADVIMLQNNAEQILSIVGKEPAHQGVITLAHIPAAISALNAAIVAHELTQAKRKAHPGKAIEVEGDSIGLRQRAGPFIELLQTSEQVGEDVVWGV
jgi:hypothetical protein